jgi:tetratricopeptide (TPR) repeat protein
VGNKTIGLIRLQQEKYELAAESLQKAVDANAGAERADVLNHLSNALKQLGRNDEAAAAMRSAMDLRQAAESQNPAPQSVSP